MMRKWNATDHDTYWLLQTMHSAAWSAYILIRKAQQANPSSASP